MKKEYSIIPIAKPRMTRRDKWLDPSRPRVKKYRDFCLQCRLEKVVLPCYGSHVTFVLPMPDSWSEKKKLQYDGKPHMQTPDWDNLGKGISDAIYSDDSGIYDIHITKLWGREGKIIIQEI
jgi:Holliday junction resolvase RusA-like endonuclease